jgi:signal transduction histidine kinase/ligand-binding sensor domain-containing protein
MKNCSRKGAKTQRTQSHTKAGFLSVFFAPLRLCERLFFVFLLALPLLALDPQKTLTQYARTSFTQMQGLPQDSIRAIAQTSDGFLWLGTDEGLARFDGYEFVTFTKSNGDLPANSITALAAAADGGLWIGTSNGLAFRRDRKFRSYTVKDGLPDDAISQIAVDHAGRVWIVAGIYLTEFVDGKFVTRAPSAELPVQTVRNVVEDRGGRLWIAGLDAVGTLDKGRFTPMLTAAQLEGMFVTPVVVDRQGNLWVGGNRGLLRRAPDGSIRRFTEREGLPNLYVRALWEDRDGRIWIGTNAGVTRFDGDRFTAPDPGADADLVRSLFEDREGNLWVGSNGGLTRYRDTAFTVYGKPEGLKSDEPNTVFQDHTGRIWVGYHDAGVLLLSPGPPRFFTTRDGLPNDEIFSIREAKNGDLLIGARGGMARLHNGRFTVYVPPDPLARLSVFDALEDEEGTIWMATGGGLCRLRGGKFDVVVRSAPLLANAAVVLGEADGAIWAGSFGRGLWRVQGNDIRQFTTAQGLPSDQIRSLYQGTKGTFWIGTFGGGLVALRNGKFQSFSERDGLLSDNVSDISDDGESLWLSTTRGICRIAKQQLVDFAEGRRKRLEPINYGLEDGLRSAQCAPSYPAGGGGNRTLDGRLWFTTTRGLAVYDPRAVKPPALAPVVQIAGMDANGEPLDLSKPTRLGPHAERIQIRYTGIHLAAPERVQYSYMLEGLDHDWVRAGSRRVINYNSLGHGVYRFTVRAELPDGLAGEGSYDFSVLPEYYETTWFRVLAVAGLLALAWAVYQLRLGQIRARFAAVIQERARLAREIHDTLAQGFVGISAQLDAVALSMPEDGTPTRKHLDLARRMARHSVTEARRSVMDLRAGVLEGQDLPNAIESGARMWVAGSNVAVAVDFSGESRELPQEIEQHVLRIAQEAVTNALKHSGATRIGIKLHMEERKLNLRIEDDGRGFDPEGVFASLGGHFGVIGMRERAERVGGELRLDSRPGEGTSIELSVPLP